MTALLSPTLLLWHHHASPLLLPRHHSSGSRWHPRWSHHAPLHAWKSTRSWHSWHTWASHTWNPWHIRHHPLHSGHSGVLSVLLLAREHGGWEGTLRVLRGIGRKARGRVRWNGRRSHLWSPTGNRCSATKHGICGNLLRESTVCHVGRWSLWNSWTRLLLLHTRIRVQLSLSVAIITGALQLLGKGGVVLLQHVKGRGMRGARRQIDALWLPTQWTSSRSVCQWCSRWQLLRHLFVFRTR